MPVDHGSLAERGGLPCRTVTEPLDVAALSAALARPVGPWRSLRVVERTGSTNADLVAAADDPEATPDHSVLLAEHQDAGRGRRGRTWEARPSEGLTLSVLLRPVEVPSERWGWAPLLTGLALVAAVESLAGTAPQAALKWPNDLLLGPDRRKGAGILAEQAPGALVIGIWVNVATPVADLPEGGTSLRVEGVERSRTEVAIALLEALADVERRWRGARGDVVVAGLDADYRARCATLGRRVRVTQPGDRVLTGTATGLDRDGRLQIIDDTNGQNTAVSAGDVVHVRPDEG